MSKNAALLAYASDRAGNGSLDIWVQQPVPGSQPIQRTFTNADEYEPAFSPDVSRIAYRSEQDGGGVDVVSALSGEPQRRAATGRGPQFSPDGRSIAFWRGNFTGPPHTAGYGGRDVFVVPASGGEEKAIHTGLAETSHPLWSPDGNSLLVYGTRGRAAGYPLARLSPPLIGGRSPAKAGRPARLEHLRRSAKQG
jgi:eukaryotic-like serine/threonine-protein kinase